MPHSHISPYDSPSHRARRERDARAQERANLKTQLRAQIASQASWVFVLLNAGGLAAIFTWIQALPLDSDAYSCNYVLLRTLPWVAASLLVGVLATAASYLLRYRASFSETLAVGWMIALAIAALSIVGAGAWVSYSITNCKSMAWDAKIGAQLQKALAGYQLATTDAERKQAWDALERSGDVARVDLDLAIAEARLRETVELEQKLQRVRELEVEFSGRSEQYGSQQFATALQEVRDLEKSLEKQLRESRAMP